MGTDDSQIKEVFEPEPTGDLYTDADGEGPAGMSDPMPEELQVTIDAEQAFEMVDPMEGEAPSG